MLAALMLSTLLAAPVDGAEPDGAGPPIHVHGNLVMPEEVYLAILQLPPKAPADEMTAILVEDQLLSFLRRSGYELAQAHAAVADGAIEVAVDEGQLEKVVLRGRLTVKTLQFKIGLNLPQDVFNRAQLDREVARLTREIGLQGVRFELLPSDSVKHSGPQIDELGAIKGVSLVHSRRPWELHIFFDEREWDEGFGLDLRSSYPDGLELGLNYQGRGLLFADDRWRVAASGGGQLRRQLVEDHLYPAPSRAFAELRWYLPEVLGGLGRPFFSLSAEAISRQRPDLRIENYYHYVTDGSVNVQHQFARGLVVSSGLGVQQRGFLGVTLPPGEVLPAEVLTPKRLRAFALLRTDLVFDSGAERWDRRHALSAEARHFFDLRNADYGEARAEYQKLWAMGWNDLILRGRGTWHWGEVLFHDEEPVGRHLRGVFGDEYARRIGSASLEYAFSITRDLIKVSLFHDLAVYGAIDRATGDEHVNVGNSFGPGFHTLIEGMLQFDLYLAFGFTARGFDSGLAASLQKVF